MNNKVTFNEDICKGCGLCVSVCPVKIISLDKDRLNVKGYTPAVVKDMDKCIACTNCATMCPDCVITVEKSPNE
jgi:2-oxoglutarate ferredoxin oxidoreductase subunit delta